MQADYELDTREEVDLINTEAAKLAKRCTAEYMAKHPGSRKFVAGAIGPTNKTLSVSPSVENPAFRGTTYDEIEQAYYEQVNLQLMCVMKLPCSHCSSGDAELGRSRLRQGLSGSHKRDPQRQSLPSETPPPKRSGRPHEQASFHASTAWFRLPSNLLPMVTVC